MLVSGHLDRVLPRRRGVRSLRSQAPSIQGAKQVDLAIFLATWVPPSILFIPLADVVFQLGLFDTRWALILTPPDLRGPVLHLAADGRYFRSIPFELEIPR